MEPIEATAIPDEWRRIPVPEHGLWIAIYPFDSDSGKILWMASVERSRSEAEEYAKNNAHPGYVIHALPAKESE